MRSYHASLFLAIIGCLLLASCATPEQTVAAVGAVAGTATALIDALRPVLSPEQVAKLHATAGHIDGTVSSVQTAVGAVAQAIADIRSATEANFVAVKSGATALAQQVATLPTQGELYAHDTGTALTAFGAARAASIAKHGFLGKQKPA